MAGITVPERNTDIGAVMTFAAQGAGTTVVQIPTGGSQGIELVVDITAIGGTPTLTVTINGRDSASNKTFALLTSAALAAVATTVLTVYPGLTAAANLTASDHVP